MKTFTSAEDMQKFAAEFISTLRPAADKATVVALSGELGAGKTTFTQGVARALGVSDAIQSPTFVIMKIYEPTHKLWTKFYHIDAYRLEQSPELENLGWQEIIADPENLVLIEWPEKVADILPEHVQINFKHVSENEREVEIT